MDTHWERFRSEVPSVRRRPSEYLRDHFWMTTQPIEEPHRPADLQKVFEHLGGTDKVMFSTDYPHWDFDHPRHAFKVRLSAEQRDNIYTENARAFYKLPARAESL
jgi:predicted TIM-barrel fold metal-dependent hydrolase